MNKNQAKHLWKIIFFILIIIPVSALATDPDEYEGEEGDDTFDRANIIILNDSNAQRHNFHKDGDEDWIKFYGLSERNYRVDVKNPGSNCDIVIKLYDTDGTTLKLPGITDSPPGMMSGWTGTAQKIAMVSIM